jgi:aminoglycoside 3-N-acetyltransferase
MEKRNIINKPEIMNGLRRLGITLGDILFVHSSLSSFGYVEGGAKTVIDALLETVGKDGTVLVPTLTGNEYLSKENPPKFNPATSECWTGIIPETLRKMRESKRSLHPTHSVAGIGKDTDLLIKDHIDSITPCDELSPYGKIASLDNSYILLIGVDLNSCTIFHHVEEIVGVDYHITKGFIKAILELDDKVEIRQYLLHKYGFERNFIIMDSLFTERGIQNKIQIGNSLVCSIKAKELVSFTINSLRVDPKLLLSQ